MSLTAVITYIASKAKTKDQIRELATEKIKCFDSNKKRRN